jgi:hypothetical protein
MEPAERRAKGAHYTSEENIRKVIDPLFLDELRAEFDKLREAGAGRQKRLGQFHTKLASLRFLDPACGCGNFLVVAYRELRMLELEVLNAIYGKQLALQLEVKEIARVNVDQFYGIELEEFPARIAETALWLTDHQVNMTFSKAFGRLYNRIPLETSPVIRHGNALRMDWAELLSPKTCSYILGNPPFIGKKEQDAVQKTDMNLIWGSAKGTGILDYVTCWYRKAADYIKGTDIRCAFVSTNSICQGEQVGILWSHLLGQGVKIHFAHRTFAWDNEASGKAHVHVVVIGFGAHNTASQKLYDYDQATPTVIETTANISPYLILGGNILAHHRTRPINGAPAINYGSMMIDKERGSDEDAGLILTPQARKEMLKECPALKPFIRRLYGGEEFLNGTERWCLWLVEAPADLLRSSKLLQERLKKIVAFRTQSSRPQTKALAATPSLFGEIRQPDSRYLLIPKVSSENRHYIPIGFMSPKEIASGSTLIVPHADLFHFGVLSSAMHNAWMRSVGGRLESRYQYSSTLVYNTFPWPAPNDSQADAIKKAAQAVLDARQSYLDAGRTLAQLYDPLAAGSHLSLLKAHRALDRAVDRAYRKEPFANERERVEYLFGLYETLTSPLAPAQPTGRSRRKSESRVHP